MEMWKYRNVKLGFTQTDHVVVNAVWNCAIVPLPFP